MPNGRAPSPYASPEPARPLQSRLSANAATPGLGRCDRRHDLASGAGGFSGRRVMLAGDEQDFDRYAAYVVVAKDR